VGVRCNRVSPVWTDNGDGEYAVVELVVVEVSAVISGVVGVFVRIGLRGVCDDVDEEVSF